MDLSCYTNSYGAEGVWVAVERVQAAGLKFIELALRGHNMGGLVIPESVVITEKTAEAEVARFRDHLQAHGVAISGCNVGGADPLTTEGVALIEQRIARASEWFGVSLVVTGAGRPSSDLERSTMIANLAAIGDFAGQRGVCVALETHQGPTQNAQAMLDLMRELNHPAVRLNFDTGNIAYYNQGLDPVGELDLVKHLIRNVHLKDSCGGFEEWHFPAIGEGGSVDFMKIHAILDRMDYQGACTIEIEGIGGEPDPSPKLRHGRVLKSVAHLRKCGF